MPRSRSSKPPAGVQVNWAHELALGLVHRTLFNDGNATDIVSQRGGIPSGASIPTSNAAESGSMLFVTGTSADKSYLDYGADPMTADLSHGPFTCIARVFYANSGGTGGGLARRNDGNTVSAGWEIGSNGSQFGLAFENATINTAYLAADPPTGKWLWVALVSDGLQAGSTPGKAIYYDGLVQPILTIQNGVGTQTSDAVQSLRVGEQNFFTVAGAQFGTSTWGAGLISDFALWRRDLSAGEVRDYVAHPYANLGMPRRRVWLQSLVEINAGHVTIGPPTISGSGSVVSTGIGSVTIDAPTISGSGDVSLSGTGTITISKPTIDGTGTGAIISGSGSITIDGPVISGAGSIIIPQPQWTTNRLFAAPPAASGVTLLPNATPWANSAWVPITNAAGGSWVLCGVIVHPDVTGAAVDFEIDIGTGLAGAEVVIDRFAGHYGATFYVSPGVLPRVIPLNNIRAASRVVARLRKSTSSTNTWTVKAYYLKRPIVGVLQTTVKPHLIVPSAAAPVTLTIGASAWANSTWTTVIASTATAIAIDAVIPDTAGFGGTEYEFDIGVGSGTPTVVDRVRLNNTQLAATDGPNVIPLYSPRSIPAGSQVSVRTRASVVAGRAATVKFQYMELPL